MSETTPTIDRRSLIPVQGPGHVYTLDGRPLAGVTSVIHAVHRSPELEEWFKRVNAAEADRIRDEAAAFGKSIHAGLSAHLKGSALVPVEMPEKWRLTLEAGIRWLEENVEEILAVEEPIASAKYGYAGQPDLVAILRRARVHRSGRLVPTILDFKTTGAIYWSHAMQLAAYRQAGKESYPDLVPMDRMILRFDKEEPGLVWPRPFEKHDRDFAAFGYCLGLYHVTNGGI